MEYIKKFTEEFIEDVLSQGVRDMPQNPASQGYDKEQIKEFFYMPEQLILQTLKAFEDEMLKIFVFDGKGNGFLSNDGTYKEIDLEVVNEQISADFTALGDKVSNVDKVLNTILEIQEAYIGGQGVDKVLSSNDYTDADKAKVNNIITNGDGNSYLANDGTYKAVQGGGADNVVIISSTASLAQGNPGKYPDLTAEDGQKILNAAKTGKAVVITSDTTYWIMSGFNFNTYYFYLTSYDIGMYGTTPYLIEMGMMPEHISTTTPPSFVSSIALANKNMLDDFNVSLRRYRLMIDTMEGSTIWVYNFLSSKSWLNIEDIVDFNLIGVFAIVNGKSGIINNYDGSTGYTISFFDGTESTYAPTGMQVTGYDNV